MKASSQSLIGWAGQDKHKWDGQAQDGYKSMDWVDGMQQVQYDHETATKVICVCADH